jgi:hypothetical protein
VRKAVGIMMGPAGMAKGEAGMEATKAGRSGAGAATASSVQCAVVALLVFLDL